jgi:hypothetical protein
VSGKEAMEMDRSEEVWQVPVSEATQFDNEKEREGHEEGGKDNSLILI